MNLCEATTELKLKYFRSIPSSEVFDGMIFPGKVMTSENVLSLETMHFGKDDVVIATYPKSGTTWSSEIISAIAHEGDTDVLNSTRIEDRVVWLELNLALHPPHSTIACQKAPLSSAKKTVWFTHLPLKLLPSAIREGKCKMLYVARNPKDQAVSFYHFHRMARYLGPQADLTWDEFFQLFCSGYLYCGSWFEHILSYWEFTRNNPNAKFISYEEMKADLMGTVKCLEEFVDIHLSIEKRSQVVEHCSFDSMKDNKMTNRKGLSLLDETHANFMRKGIVGDWKNYFTIAQNEAFDNLYKKKMDLSGLYFEFQ